MKRSFMLFPLVALFIAVCRFISWFHLRFSRLFLGKPLKCVSDSKQSSSRFPSLLASSLMIIKEEKNKNNNLRFSKRNNPESEIKVDPSLSLERRTLFLFLWLTWKENRGASLSLALLASLAQYRQTSNDWLPVICVFREAARALFLCVWMCSTVNEVVWVFGRKGGKFQVQPLDGGATPDSKPPSLDEEEEIYNCIYRLSRRTQTRQDMFSVAKFKYKTTLCFDICKEVSLDSLGFWLPIFLPVRLM